MTNAEILKSALHYTNHSIPVHVFEHGTVVIGVSTPSLACQVLSKVYDIPFHGEGSPAGDIEPLSMDDGNTMFAFSNKGVFTIRSPDDLKKDLKVEKAATERFLHFEGLHAEQFAAMPRELPFKEKHDNETLQLLAHALEARAARSRDAVELKVALSWSPAVS